MAELNARGEEVILFDSGRGEEVMLGTPKVCWVGASSSAPPWLGGLKSKADSKERVEPVVTMGGRKSDLRCSAAVSKVRAMDVEFELLPVEEPPMETFADCRLPPGAFG